MKKTYVSLLRGINVSGVKKVPMPELKKLYEKIGLQHVTTYIQSGNVVFVSDKDKQTITQLIEKIILSHFGFEVSVLVLDESELNAVISSNPFLGTENIDVKQLYVTFLFEKPAEDKIQEMGSITSGNEAFKIKGNTVYGYYPDGYGKAKLNNNFFEKKLKVSATTRNWQSTVALQKLIEQTSENL